MNHFEDEKAVTVDNVLGNFEQKIYVRLKLDLIVLLLLMSLFLKPFCLIVLWLASM